MNCLVSVHCGCYANCRFSFDMKAFSFLAFKKKKKKKGRNAGCDGISAPHLAGVAEFIQGPVRSGWTGATARSHHCRAHEPEALMRLHTAVSVKTDTR